MCMAGGLFPVTPVRHCQCACPGDPDHLRVNHSHSLKYYYNPIWSQYCYTDSLETITHNYGDPSNNTCGTQLHDYHAPWSVHGVSSSLMFTSTVQATVFDALNDTLVCIQAGTGAIYQALSTRCPIWPVVPRDNYFGCVVLVQLQHAVVYLAQLLVIIIILSPSMCLVS